jgi:hypothetical protein
MQAFYMMRKFARFEFKRFDNLPQGVQFVSRRRIQKREATWNVISAAT